ncbi:MAG TPA: helix-turn-helix domain-containing protein [Solirubrobacteraceae bacterium]|jgi:DNA-binding transcriptional ArsR family regulator|nr:helix-turn-helix domain-containing protein [Solirubrobacteraceae bacterium]
MTKEPRQVITDARTMRAMAHPLRVRLLEAIIRDGELTATQAAELLGESPGNMSWHLQTLAKYGFIEEAGEGRGRTRPWRAVSRSRSFDTGMGDPEQAAAGDELERTFVMRTFDQLRDWWSQRLGYSEKWRRAAFTSEAIIYVTAEELEEIMEEVIAIRGRFKDRERDKGKRPGGSLPVHLYAHAHPMPPTPSGN